MSNNAPLKADLAYLIGYKAFTSGRANRVSQCEKFKTLALNVSPSYRAALEYNWTVGYVTAKQKKENITNIHLTLTPDSL